MDIEYNSPPDHGVINPKYRKRIQILREDLDRGKLLYTILHKRSYFHKAKHHEVPEAYKTHTTFEKAESAAVYLLANYEKYFI